MEKNYVKLEKHEGIYKNKKTKRYLAVKKIRGAQFSESFDKVRDAIHWRKTFGGFEEKGNCARKAKTDKKNKTKDSKKLSPTLLDVWNCMRKLHFPGVEMNTISTWERQFKILKTLHYIRMDDFVPSVIDHWLEKTKHYYSTGTNNRRYNLKRELALLVTIFSWYKNEPEAGDYKFVSPILRRHKKNCVIKPLPLRNKRITPEDAFKFINLMPQPYRDLALFQFLTASRIGEAAGAQFANINLETRELVIKDCCVWDTSKRFAYLKSFPKNGDVRYCHVNDLLLEIVERRIRTRHPSSDFLFHLEGKPLGYRWIQHAYNTAQKKAGVPQRGTHVLRHGMATLARKLTRSLDATMAMTGHKDVKLADHYSEIGKEVQKETSLKIERHLRKIFG